MLAPEKNQRIEISVIIPITERYHDLEKLYLMFVHEVERVTTSYEFLFVVDGGFEAAFELAKQLKSTHPPIRIIKFTRRFGESAALSVAFQKSRGDYIVIVPSYFQVIPSEVGKILAALLDGDDVVVARRYPRIDPLFNRLQSYAFHWLISRLLKSSYHDIGCGLRGIRRQVLEEINLYGDLHRFLPTLAERQGFNVREVPVRQSPEDVPLRVYPPGTYVRRLLDILTLFFLMRFTYKPLRFFGIIGMFLFVIGSCIDLYLGLYRILGYGGIAERPLLLLGTLLVVFGVQIFSIGLIGEMIVFTHSKELREYHIDQFLA